MTHWLLKPATRRCDGGGHLSRALALAISIPSDHQITFELDRPMILPTALKNLVKVHSADWQSREAYDVVVVDGYHFTARDILDLRKRTKVLAAVHDFGDPLNPTDVIISPTCPVRSYPDDPKFVLHGLRYLLVSPRLQDWRLAEIRKVATHIVVMFGLVDSKNMTGLALSAIKQAGLHRRTKVTVLLGKHAPHKRSVVTQARASGGNVAVEFEPSNVFGILADCDLAIGAGGVGLLERLAIGVPTITIQTASNQRHVIEAVGEFTRTLQATEELNVEYCAEEILRAFDDSNWRRNVSEASRLAIDCRGPARVVEALLLTHADASTHVSTEPPSASHKARNRA